MKDVYNFPKGYSEYKHAGTWIPGASFNIAGGGSSFAWTQTGVGFSVAPYPYGDNPGCLNLGQHLHQGASSAWVPQSAAYHTPLCYKYTGCTPTPGNDGDGITYPITNLMKHQYYQQWCWGQC